MHRRSMIAAMTAALIAGSALAQHASFDAPRAKIGFLAGRYTTETVMPPAPSMPQGATGNGSSDIAWTLDSMFLAIDEQGTNSLFGRYWGRGFLGYDASSQNYVLNMFNNSGDHPVYTGTFSGDTLVLGTNVPMPGHPFDQKLLWYKQGDTIRLTVLNDTGDGFMPVLDQIARPVPQISK